MDLREVLETIAFGLIVIGLVAAVLLAIFGLPILIGWAVFSVVSSPSISPIVKVVMFAVYTVGVFLVGVFLTGSTYEDEMKNIREIINKCENKVASISRDIKYCDKDVRNSVESKIYDILSYLKAIEKKA
ncbi:MAG: hypothetical protein JHC26_12630 [Thermofilum sp.]|jgi:ABC-type multidrug transport system fused ATPase/permease subunit|uniref:hypothetical protein n=1 Tax=Thermofilum sp. TaxID=1961369 RepID=UPI00258AF9D4|nr:hypothetical protein [Thermofilum sp.]MCI4409931.1 hypothetical protein [Thermofilum sp.]